MSSGNVLNVDSDLSNEQRFVRKKPRRKLTASLATCCLFLALLCAALIATLVLLGRHLGYISQSKYHSSAPTISNVSPLKRNFIRLPNNTIPLHYDLTLKPNLDRGTFLGAVNITINVSQKRKTLVLNSNKLNINHVELIRGNDSKVVQVSNVQDLAFEEVIIIFLKEEIVPQKYFLYIKFGGGLTKKYIGFYLSQYFFDGKARSIATSKFEPTYARQAFPCFDEPHLKATYKIHLLKPNNSEYIALSNYPQESEEDHEDGKLVHFKETVSMSTYLVAFIVCDFKKTSTTFKNNDTEVPFNVFASPGQLNKTTYAGKVGKDIIEFYVKYFGIPYPLPKLDLVAIPDFVSGAMENWGLVTYRETALLYTPETHSAANQQRVLEVVSHELAHSWFGNLVTMNWWDNLWLNEGFASYIEYKGGEAAEPSFRMMEQFTLDNMHGVMQLDATYGSHPIIIPVNTPDQITEVFDLISYNKGASVLRMLEGAVGPKNFQDGVTAYLNKYKYSNTVTKQLWDEIQQVVGSSINVHDFMDTFTVQMGYPIVNVEFKDGIYILRQKRFLLSEENDHAAKPSPYDYKWTIPITYVSDTGKSKVFWFNRNQSDLKIKPGEHKWLKFNFDQIGYYRVNYSKDLYDNLFENWDNLSLPDKTHLMEETFSVAKSGQVGYDVPLDLTKFLKNETDYTVWEVAAAHMNSLKLRLRNFASGNDFGHYMATLVQNAYNSLGWTVREEDDHLTRRARVIVLDLACNVDYEPASKEVDRRFNDWLTTRDVSPDIKPIVYAFGLQKASEEKWYAVFEIFKNETDANEKLQLMKGLAGVKNPALISRLIELAKDESNIRSQDYFNLLQLISRNHIGLPIVWDYIRENWEYLVERFYLNDRNLGSLIPGVTKSFASKVKLEEMETFFKKYPEAGAGTANRARALETVKNNIIWLEKYKNSIEDWIKKNKNSDEMEM